MNIYEAISNDLQEITELDSHYLGNILVESTVVSYKPVDFTLNEINIPLESKDVDFIFEKKEVNSKTTCGTYNMNKYFPTGQNITLPNGQQFKVTSYGEPKKIDNQDMVDIFCTTVSDITGITERVDNSNVTKNIIKDIETLLTQNQKLASQLYKYHFDWLKYGQLIDSINYEKSNALLNTSDIIQMQKNSELTDLIKSMFTLYGQDIPLEIKNKVYSDTLNICDLKVPVYYNSIRKNMTYNEFLTWYLYCVQQQLLEPVGPLLDEDAATPGFILARGISFFYYDNVNIDDIEIGKNNIAIRNQNNEKPYIDLSIDSENVGTMLIDTSDLCNYKFEVKIFDPQATGSPIEYTMAGIDVYTINKSDGIKTYISNPSNQNNNFYSLCEVLKITNGYYSNGADIASDYYTEILDYMSTFNLEYREI